jgi:predicted SnoaL-like aldol condensation-catalyzing enzyme
MDDFAYLFYTAKNVTAAFDKYFATNYVQHNPNIADGRAAAIAALDPLFSSPTTSFDVSEASNENMNRILTFDAIAWTQIARVMVGPEYTVIHINAITAGQPNYNVYDVYRTEGSCIVEHWDVMAAATVDNTTVSPHP